MAEKKEFVERITPQSEDFSRWYLDCIRFADLMDYAPVRGCMVIKPDGYDLWERIQQGLDRRFKETGHRNAYFPVFIPESLFEKEKEHVEGFNPELPWVTEVGGEPLEERLAIRPTSETMFGYMYSRWIQSYRDLPVLLNQWCNVVRWEKRTLPFLRTTEFLWQEGHTAHANEAEAREETMRMLEVYRDFVESELAIPVIKGKKTPSEKFAGAVDTFSIEAMMQDGRALQAGTSHYMGENFARVFDITYLDESNERRYVHTTSWGVTTRLIGALIMVHGDDRGLVLPPRMAHTQVIIIPVGPRNARSEVIAKAESVHQQLLDAGVRAKCDFREEMSPGWKFNEYEMRGIPLRIELGPRDIKADQCILVRRDTGEKTPIPLSQIASVVQSTLDTQQTDLLRKADEFRLSRSVEVDHIDQAKAALAEKNQFFLTGWCGKDECEAKIKEEVGVTARNIPLDPPTRHTSCIACGEEAPHTVWYGKSY